MPVSLRNDIEKRLSSFDPVGAQIRKLKSRINSLEKKGTISAKEYKEISSGHLKLHELEQQRKELVSFESMLDRKTGKLMKLSKAYDRLTEQYDAGKVEPYIYEQALNRLYATLAGNNEQGSVAVENTIGLLQTASIGHNIEMTLLNGCGALLMIFIVIPTLFSCTFH